METNIASVWRVFFAEWPPTLLRRGVAITNTNEQVPFSDFVMSDQMVIFERPTPDSVGGRRVAIPFALIAGVKFTEPLKTEQLISAGYQGKPQAMPPKSAPAVSA